MAHENSTRDLEKRIGVATKRADKGKKEVVGRRHSTEELGGKGDEARHHPPKEERREGIALFAENIRGKGGNGKTRLLSAAWVTRVERG